jgi:hypothetical protein
MDLGEYRKWVEQYVTDALQKSDCSNAGIAEYLSMIKPAGRFSSHRDEKNLALTEVRKAFDEHRHWPLSIIISFLGIENKDLLKK